ncbi:MAG: carbohydrate kinase family protein [Actinobacteria bacterium]|nr:carbohydrate kinase family protein [Actinomycetota bacterium]
MSAALPRWAAAVGLEPSLLVVGGASLDVLHVRGRPTPSAGGAGLYTGLAAVRAGAGVTMLAPRPEPMPDTLAPAARRLRWVGPAVPPEELPRFEIAYAPDGSVARFESAMGAEPGLRPSLLDGLGPLPPLAFCVPFLDAALQLAFVEDLGRRGCLTAANTYSCAAREHPETVRRTAAAADVFFCNAAEAALLFGSADDVPCRPGALVFVTRGADGATVVQGRHRTDLPAPAADALDPTGAGDTFCGTTLARLLAGAHPVEAARAGIAAASEMVGAVGPARLLEPAASPAPDPDALARVDDARVAALASLIGGLDEAVPFDFTGPVLPDDGDPAALDWFFAATLQQYGFWSRADGHHGGPTYATIGGRRLKGSDYLWAAYLRWRHDDPGGLSPESQAEATPASYTARLADDGGTTPLPALESHASLAADYGRTMTALGTSPAAMVHAANRSERPLAALLSMLDHVGGYREDPLRKKSALLAIILRQRPERWLRDVPGDDAPPIVDYHVQRTCLRTGAVVPAPALEEALVERRVVGAAEEAAVRRSAYRAVTRLVEISGKPMGAVDWFLFQMRHRCPEMSDPDCAACPAAPACARRVDLFQPVYRTTAY